MIKYLSNVRNWYRFPQLHCSLCLASHIEMLPSGWQSGYCLKYSCGTLPSWRDSCVSGMVVGRERTVEAVCCQWSQTTCRTVKSLFCSGSSASVASFTLEPWLWAKTVLRWLSDKMTEVQAAARTWINLLPTLPPARRNLLPEVIDRQSLSPVLTLQASQEPACSASGFADYMLTL